MLRLVCYSIVAIFEFWVTVVMRAHFVGHPDSSALLKYTSAGHRQHHRGKLETDPAAPRVIQTERRIRSGRLSRRNNLMSRIIGVQTNSN
jgi:hypothetical protein